MPLEIQLPPVIQAPTVKLLSDKPVVQVKLPAPSFDVQEQPNPHRMAKSAPQPVKPQPVNVMPDTPPTGSVGLEWNGVPIDIATFFGVAIPQADQKTMDMLKDINTWSKENPDDDIGNRMLKIRKLEQKLGAPALNESRVTKAWNWIRMDMSLTEMRKRQKAYEA